MFEFFTKSLMIIHMLLGLVMIGLILLQRGRGGGLAGSLGGMGGQSFLGNKAGDIFTTITMWVATSWIVLNCVCVVMANNCKTKTYEGPAKTAVPTGPDDDKQSSDKSADGESKTDTGSSDMKDKGTIEVPGKAEPKQDAEKPAEDPKKPDQDKPGNEAPSKEEASKPEESKPKDAPKPDGAEKKPEETDKKPE